ncbi:hypothetical protein BDY21DRAFT_361046 [Lineolata rhizophorae]|uniref:SNF5-domain-containing protein n=1 Tax=Lineolata rhizophorae TaxID=578093 RepID=A0A6A6PAR8_9PEZI|nr:hypothetical protein BDY21DRAFT_361046 [Lineolata rhizophorae]
MSPASVNAPQAFISSYAPRIRTYANSLLTPVIQPTTNQLPPTRTTKRGTAAVNYAEDGFEDEDFDDSEGPRRPTGLRSLRRVDDSSADKTSQGPQLGKELTAPVELQGIWRDWMGKPKRILRNEAQNQVQCQLPVTLIPIRIDLDIQSFRPEAPLPTPANARDFGIDESLPAYKQPDPTPAYRLKDMFMWNLHEACVTPDQFARIMVDELDFPSDRKAFLTQEITTQIRTQLEQYAGVALHPLFHPSGQSPVTPQPDNAATPAAGAPAPPATPAGLRVPARSRDASSTPAPPPSTTVVNGISGAPTPNAPVSATITVPTKGGNVTATASELPADDTNNPDDAYRCIINLNINLMNKLYSDKFEWSLLHPSGFPEIFAKQTCQDLGLGGEWVVALSHAIYEASLRLKKEIFENGGLLGGYGEVANDAADETTEAGWRYDHEHLADAWEPKVEELSKEEIEKREGDRERQIRRLRRETARFSSTANMNVGGDYFNQPEEQPMGRGERNKKKRRFRSLSPQGRETPEAGGYGGQSGTLSDWERQNWRCSHCMVWGGAVWAVRDGPRAPRSLCHNCGWFWERDKKLPSWTKNMFAHQASYGHR